jgi:tetratricopeptide (TPR) repeat protein
MTAELTAQQHRIAAERAMEATLWDDAAREYEAALSLVAAEEGAGEDEAALLTALGACYWNLAEARTAWRTLRRAIALCRDRGDGAGMARATVEILRIWGPPERHRAMADEALAALGAGDPYLRAQLLVRRRTWYHSDDDLDDAFREAITLAEQHGFEDLLTMRTQLASRRAFDEGRIDESISLTESAHESYARLRRYDQAAGVLRGAGFVTMAYGRLDQGAALAARTLAYAREVHLRFTEQLALMDLAGEAFARCDFSRSRDLIAQSPGDVDFRGDLYKMWMTELAGDIDGALRQMVNPERSGGATTALSQTHCANAGVLFHANSLDAARQALQTWAEVARQGDSICDEVPAIFDCLVALGDDALLGEVHAALERDAARPSPTTYCTLQGRALAPARGAVALRLGRLDEAERAYRDGLAWCERESVPIDAAHCHAGLSGAARARGDEEAAATHLAHAASIFEAQHARLWLDQLVAARR